MLTFEEKVETLSLSLRRYASHSNSPILIIILLIWALISAVFEDICKRSVYYIVLIYICLTLIIQELEIVGSPPCRSSQ